MRKRERISDLFNARYSFAFREVRQEMHRQFSFGVREGSTLLYVLWSRFNDHLGMILGSSQLTVGECPTAGHNELLVLPSICRIQVLRDVC
jgi:hypothetical protein